MRSSAIWQPTVSQGRPTGATSRRTCTQKTKGMEMRLVLSLLAAAGALAALGGGELTWP